jgi:soluble lytic murein transglycosylase-like protein
MVVPPSDGGDRMRLSASEVRMLMAGLTVGVIACAPTAIQTRRSARTPRRVPARATLSDLDTRAVLADLELRAQGLDRAAGDLQRRYARDVEPLVRQLQPYNSDRALVARIATALVREGTEAGIDPRLLASVLLVEDPRLDPRAVSPVGAVGLMQVMPRHAGGWGCGSDDLTDVDVNVCHGARILANAITVAQGDLDRALLLYNGCVHGENTPDCGLYPQRVYRHAGLAMRQRPRPVTAGDQGW